MEIRGEKSQSNAQLKTEYKEVGEDGIHNQIHTILRIHNQIHTVKRNETMDIRCQRWCRKHVKDTRKGYTERIHGKDTRKGYMGRIHRKETRD